jgi:hypothetical protein
LAYQLWLDAGRPEGCSEKHWLEAERRVARSEIMVNTADLTLYVRRSLRGRTSIAPPPARQARPQMAKAVA